MVDPQLVELHEAVKRDLSLRPFLLDWLEEHGYHLARWFMGWADGLLLVPVYDYERVASEWFNYDETVVHTSDSKKWWRHRQKLVGMAMWRHGSSMGEFMMREYYFANPSMAPRKNLESSPMKERQQ